MTIDAVEPPRPRNFKDASPKEVRAALVPEEQPDFDRQWRKALTEAAESQDLTGVFRVLDSWRRRATTTNYLGHDGYRELLARAERILSTGEPELGSVPWNELKGELGLQAVTYLIEVSPEAREQIRRYPLHFPSSLPRSWQCSNSPHGTARRSMRTIPTAPSASSRSATPDKPCSQS
ncbi:DUF6247 family protein [Actinophytocola sp.]|uniref:DUF6247 family protein n=1 Tax=Actinophytocola sp. TaxID=1872138 RepID=UPI00389A76E7